ncbi:MAG: tetratricopeptide repeat protein [Pseudomonadota bacterium]
MSVFDVSADNIFAAGLSSSGQLENFAQRALTQGLELFVAKKYDQAIPVLQRAAGLSPRSTTAINAYDYMARSHLANGDANAAIQAYQQALRIDTGRDDIRMALGNAYYSEDRFEEARREYEQGVKLNPSAANRYSLGQGYLATGEYDQALIQFEQVKRIESREPYGDTGLGQAYAKMGQYDQAIAAFESAIATQPDYWEAYSEMGYALVDMGETERAAEMVETLRGNASELADNLSSYLYEKSAPKMTATYASELYAMFPSSLGPATRLSNVSAYLAAPSSSQTFSMVFQFSKPMDARSVENEQNWTITRHLGTGRGDGYNLGVLLPPSEVSLPGKPEAVYYDANTLTATVLFKIQQNATGDGTLDPSHIKFAFAGEDVLGMTMDGQADEYIGYKGFA